MNPFLRKWYAWQKQTPPFEAYFAGEKRAPTYALELELDHIRSGVRSLVADFTSDKTFDFDARIAAEQVSLDAVAVRLSESNDDVTRLVAWVAGTRDLLAEFRRYLG